MNKERKMALLIDAENISAQYADYIIDEITNYGECLYKRIYGSWDKIVQTKWEGQINKNSLKPMMQFNNTRGKNASDSALIIDAMDILYRGNVDGFCIVSSDSDFTSLARRLAESGLLVIGMGESDKATEALENAFDKFVYIDVLAKEAEAEKKKEADAEAAAGIKPRQERKSDQTGNIPSKKLISSKIKQIIMANEDLGKPTDLGQIGNELSRLYRNFDVRYYDKKGGGKYKFLREFVADLRGLEIERIDKRVFVSIKK